MIDMDKAERLAGYLDEAQADARFWENSHCLLFLARWAARERPGFDLDRYLGRCSSALSAMRILKAEGGIDAFMAREAAQNGLDPVDAAQARVGAIGLVRAPRHGRPGFLTFGCIRHVDSWAIRALDGVVSIHVDTIRAQPHMVWKV